MKKINWKVRFKNPVFIAHLLLSVFAPVLGYFGLVAQDLTSWKVVFDLVVDAISNPYIVGLMLVSFWNAINDPTTKGISDSEQAQRYKQPK